MTILLLICDFKRPFYVDKKPPELNKIFINRFGQGEQGGQGGPGGQGGKCGPGGQCEQGQG